MSLTTMSWAATLILLSASCAEIAQQDELDTQTQTLHQRGRRKPCQPPPPPPPPAAECLFGDSFYALRTEAPLTIEAERWIRALADLESALQGEQLVVAVQQSSHTDVTTPAEALERVDQNEVRHMLLLDAPTGRRYEVFEYGAGDNSYGAIFRAGTLQKVTSIHDGDLLECTEE